MLIDVKHGGITSNKPLSSLSSKQNRGVSAGASVDETCDILLRASSPDSRFDLIQNHSSLKTMFVDIYQSNLYGHRFSVWLFMERSSM
jgi:hypothetical protein